MTKKVRDETVKGALRQGSLYILLAALLMGVLWRGAYFPTSTDAFIFPDSLFTPRWSTMALLLLAGAWETAALLVDRNRDILRSPVLWLFAAFTFFSGLTYFWSSFPAVTSRDFLLLLALLSALLSARGQLVRFPERTPAFLASWLVYAATFVSAWGIVTYVLRTSPYANEVDGIFRAGGTLEYSNALACFSLMAIPFAAALMGRSGKDDRVLLGVAMTIMSAAVFLSLSRSALLILMLVSLYLLFLNRREIGFALILTSLAMGLVMAGAALLAAEAGLRAAGIIFPAAVVPLAYYTQEYLTEAGREMAMKVTWAAASLLLLMAAAAMAVTARARNIIYERFGEGFTLSRLLPHREDTWAGALDAFRERPVKGWGLGSFPQVYQDFSFTSYTKYAHNLVLQAAVDGGLIGAALMALFLLMAAALAVWRLAGGADTLARAAAVAALVFILFNMFDWEWYLPALAAWFMAVVALLEVRTGTSQS